MGLFDVLRKRSVAGGDESVALSHDTDNWRNRLLRDNEGISYGAAELSYFNKTGDDQSTTLDPDRALKLQRNSLMSHKRGRSTSSSQNLSGLQRLPTMTFPKSGPNMVGDFTTIDWMNEDSRYLERQVNENITMAERLFIVYIVLVVTGVVTGTLGAVLDLSVEFLVSFRTGFCKSNVFLSSELCCLTDPGEVCDDFYRWDDAFGGMFGSYLPNVLLACMYAIISAFLVKRFAPYAAGSGIPEIKAVLNGVVMRGYLSAWTLVIKVIGLALAVGSGLNLGKEGPVVHLASCTAFITANKFKLFRYNKAGVRHMLSCACAAGVATAFGAPVGGILFAFEEASTFFTNDTLWRSFFCSTVAAIVLKVSNPFYNGSLVMFEVRESVAWLWFELIPIAVIGLAGGFIGFLWIKLNLQWMKFKLRNPFLKGAPVVEALCLTLVTVSMNWIFPFLRNTNSALLKILFQGCASATPGEWTPLLCDGDRRFELTVMLIYGTVQKFLLSALTFGSRVPAGLFVPSLTIGAIFGKLIGVSVHQLATAMPDLFIFRECLSSTQCQVAGGAVYAIVGAAAVLAGVTQVSVSLAVIVLELTNQLNLLLPIMITVFLAKMVTNMFGTPSIYDSYIHMRRYPFLEGGAVIEHDFVTAGDIMRSRVMCIPRTGLTMGMLEKVYQETSGHGYPIVKDMDSKLLHGYLSRIELKVALQTAARDTTITSETPVIFSEMHELDEPLINDDGDCDLGKWADFYVAQVWDSTPLSKVYQLAQRTGLQQVIVVNEGQVVGIISKKDIISFIDTSEEIPRKYFL